MSAILIILAAVVLLIIGYVFYGGWLAKQWGIEPDRKTPAQELEDGVDYVAAKPAVLMGHHFFFHRRCRSYQRTNSGICIWMAAGIFMVRYRRYFLWRFTGFWFSVCIYSPRRQVRW